MLNPSQSLFYERDTFFGFQQLGWGAILEQRQRCVEPMGCFALIPEYSNGVCDNRNQTVDNLVHCHIPIVAANANSSSLSETTGEEASNEG